LRLEVFFPMEWFFNKQWLSCPLNRLDRTPHFSSEPFLVHNEAVLHARLLCRSAVRPSSLPLTGFHHNRVRHHPVMVLTTLPKAKTVFCRELRVSFSPSMGRFAPPWQSLPYTVFFWKTFPIIHSRPPRTSLLLEPFFFSPHD